MVDNNILDDLSLKLSDFYFSSHQIVFAAICDLAKQGRPYDILSVSDYLKAAGSLADIGGIQTLAEMGDTCPASANVTHYAATVKSLSARRQLLTASAEIGKLAESEPDPDRAVSEARAQLEVVETTLDDGEDSDDSFGAAVHEAVDYMEAVANGSSPGLSTGFPALDAATMGLHPGALVIVAGRPGMGKSTLSANFLENVGLAGKVGLFFSLEMPRRDIALRSKSSLSGVHFENIRDARRLADDEFERVSVAAQRLANTRLYIDDRSALSVAQMASKARKVKRLEGGQLDLIVVDYLQLASSSLRKADRTQQVEEISRDLKAMAKTLDVPVVALSQLSRSVESRTDRRPLPSDLRQSGAIEQDADLILFVYRDEVYHADSTDAGIAEIIIGKNRNGPMSTVRLGFEGEHCRFTHIDSGEWGDSVPFEPEFPAREPTYTTARSKPKEAA